MHEKKLDTCKTREAIEEQSKIGINAMMEECITTKWQHVQHMWLDYKRSSVCTK